VCSDGDASDEILVLGLQNGAWEFNIFVILNLHSSAFLFPLSPSSPVHMLLLNIPNTGNFTSLHICYLVTSIMLHFVCILETDCGLSQKRLYQ
jgi:hypothetical protein